MKLTNLNNINKKHLIVFDLDGTLAKTKAPMDSEMAGLVEDLLKNKKVAIIGGGKLELFKHQFLNELKAPKEYYKHLYLFPTTATTFLRYDKSWKKIYEHKLSKTEVTKILESIKKAVVDVGYKHPEKTYGKVVENRGTQVTWSALGQDVVKVLGMKGVELKNEWSHKNSAVKMKIAKELIKLLPNLEVRAAGHTSIDITKKGIDKAYGLKQIEKYVKVKIKDMLFVGDSIFPGGNDHAITKTKVDYIPVKDPEDTKKVIKAVLKV